MKRKQSPPESDITRLKAKIAERSAAAEKPEGISTLRSLRKRLKRAQRKMRALAERQARAHGKKKTETKAPTPT
jgi:hypothetical protein